jgi:hypothetical protein
MEIGAFVNGGAHLLWALFFEVKFACNERNFLTYADGWYIIMVLSIDFLQKEYLQ